MAQPPLLCQGVSRAVLLASAKTHKKLRPRKQRTYRRSSLRGEYPRLPKHYKISISLRPGRAASSGQRRHDEIIPSILLVAALIVLSANRPLLSVADGV